MSNSLIITKQTGNFFSLALNDDEVVISDQNRLTTVGNFCHFKTANGANIVKEQNVLFSDITLITSGSATFASVNALWVGLINAGFFDGLGTGGGGGGASDFTDYVTKGTEGGVFTDGAIGGGGGLGDVKTATDEVSHIPPRHELKKRTQIRLWSGASGTGNVLYAGWADEIVSFSLAPYT